MSGVQPLGSGGVLEYARVDLDRQSRDTTFGTKTCTRGRHVARSAGRFGLTSSHSARRNAGARRRVR